MCDRKWKSVKREYETKSMKRKLKDNEVYIWNWLFNFTRKNYINIEFVKVKAHSNNEGNKIVEE